VRLSASADDAILAHMDTADIEAIKARWLRPIAPIDSQLNAVEAIAERCSSPFFTVQYGPVGMEWCSDKLLAEVAKRAEASQRRVHMHMLESRYQRAWADRAYPEGPVARLAKLGLLSPRLTLAHGTWHAGPYFTEQRRDFYNLELTDTNTADYTVCYLPEPMRFAP